MPNKYITKIKEFLYEKEILPIIVRSKHLQANSLDEIVKLMKPVPYEQIKDKSPIEFAREIKSILKY